MRIGADPGLGGMVRLQVVDSYFSPDQSNVRTPKFSGGDSPSSRTRDPLGFEDMPLDESENSILTSCPQQCKGQRIKIKSNHKKSWSEGTIVAYDEDDKKFLVCLQYIYMLCSMLCFLCDCNAVCCVRCGLKADSSFD